MARLDHIVLVHGAAHGAWCWEDVVPLLEARSFRVTAVDLPGLGQDPTPPGQVTLQHYIDCVAAALRSVSCRALLVGHSMGSIAISGAAEAVPEKVGKLLYVAAVLPAAGTAVGGIDLGPDSASRRSSKARRKVRSPSIRRKPQRFSMADARLTKRPAPSPGFVRRQ